MSANQNKNRFATKIHIKSGDQVMIIAGKDKGKTGTVSRVITGDYRAVVEGLNIAKKHVKATDNNSGGIQEVAMPLHISNISLIDPKSGTPTRISRKEVDGKTVRISKKSGEIIK
jgi:large subunit ribosomal protein L24